MILQHTTRRAMRYPLRVAARRFASKTTPETPPSAPKATAKEAEAPKKPDVDAAAAEGSKTGDGAPKAAAKKGGMGPVLYLSGVAVGAAGFYYSQYGLELPEALGGSPLPPPAKKIVQPVIPPAKIEKAPEKIQSAHKSASSAASDATLPASSASATPAMTGSPAASSATSGTKAQLMEEPEDAECAIDEQLREQLSSANADKGDAPAVPAAGTAVTKAQLTVEHEEGKSVMEGFVSRDDEKERLGTEHSAGREAMETILAEGPETVPETRRTQEERAATRAQLQSILGEDLSDGDRLAKLDAALASAFEILSADDPVYEEASTMRTHLQINRARADIAADLRLAFLERNTGECARLIRRAKSYGIDYFYEMYLAEYFTAPGRLLEILHDNATGPYADAPNFKVSDFIHEEDKVLQGLDDVGQLRQRCLEHAAKLAGVQVHYRADATKRLDTYVEAVEEQTSTYVRKAMKLREMEVAAEIVKAQGELREKLRNEFNEELRDSLEEQEKHLQQRFSNDLAQEHLAYELALERDREDFLLEQNELKAEVASYYDVLQEHNAHFEVFRTHRKLVNALLAIEKQIKNGHETNFDLVEDAFIREACEVTGHPRGVVFQEPKDFIDSFNCSLRSWVVSAFRTDDSIANSVLAQLFGRLYCVDRRGFTPSTSDNEVEKGISGLQIAAAHVEGNDLTNALHSMETLEGTPALLEHVKPWITRARTSLVLQQQLDLLRAQVACLHVTYA